MSAQGDLELLRRFVNTVDPDEDTDAVDTPERLSTWLSDNHLLEPGTVLTAQDHRRALRFRESVRDLALANGGHEIAERSIEAFNETVRPTRLTVRLDESGSATLVADGAGIDRPLGRLLQAMLTAMADGSWSRLKSCSNDGCRWLYFDHSKNMSKKWCSMETCGNVINARAYRRRRRQSG